MTTAKALKIVLSLAEQNVVGEDDHDLASQRATQLEAIALVEGCIPLLKSMED